MLVSRPASRGCSLVCPTHLVTIDTGIHLLVFWTDSFTLRKLECSKQAIALNMLAWNNDIGLWFYFVGCSRTEVMIDRDSWGRQYSEARGEILGPSEDKQLRKHLARMFSLIKNESWGIEDDQIPS